jgi:hypothetical protein
LSSTLDSSTIRLYKATCLSIYLSDYNNEDLLPCEKFKKKVLAKGKETTIKQQATKLGKLWRKQ